jgi:hypothetical protein
MALARMILAALIAASLAVVPIGGTTVSTSITPVEMSMADQADMPCCPLGDQDKGSMGSALKCVCAAAILPTAIVISHIPDAATSVFVDATLHDYISHPIHPPPI